MKIILTLLLLLIIPILAFADDFIYDKPYGGKKVGRTDDKGFIYDKPYGGKKIGRVKDVEGDVGSESNLNIEDKTMNKILCNHEVKGSRLTLALKKGGVGSESNLKKQ